MTGTNSVTRRRARVTDGGGGIGAATRRALAADGGLY